MIGFRTLNGTSILPFEEEILYNNLFTYENIYKYIKKLNSICKDFYKELKNNKYIDIYYGDTSVFLILKIKNIDTIDIYNNFVEELEKYLSIKKLNLIRGTSFGFRNPRIEIIKRNNDNCIRLSLGVYKGIIYYEIKKFIKKWRINEG